jgi:hypothetical protein
LCGVTETFTDRPTLAENSFKSALSLLGDQGLGMEVKQLSALFALFYVSIWLFCAYFVLCVISDCHGHVLVLSICLYSCSSYFPPPTLSASNLLFLSSFGDIIPSLHP